MKVLLVDTQQLLYHFFSLVIFLLVLIDFGQLGTAFQFGRNAPNTTHKYPDASIVIKMFRKIGRSELSVLDAQPYEKVSSEGSLDVIQKPFEDILGILTVSSRKFTSTIEIP